MFHLPAGEGRCELHWVDLNAGLEGLDLAFTVRAWRKRNNLTEQFEEGKIIPMPGVEVPDIAYLQTRKAWVTSRIIAMPSEAQMFLKIIWPDGVPKISECTNEQLDLVVKQVEVSEMKHDVQFFMADPTKPSKPRKNTKPKVIK